jgi:hypothetical protein
MEQDQTSTVQDSEEAALPIREMVAAELAKLKEDATYVPALPRGIVLDAEMPHGFYVKRPCREEYLAAYPNGDYDAYFANDLSDEDREVWGPGWSNPSWVKGMDELQEQLPEVLVIQSQVRRQATRTTRARSPSRHRFKQFLFGDPSYRLVRNGQRQVPATKVLAHVNELIEQEAMGLLSVHFIDGRRLNLELLKGGLLEVEGAPLPAPLPNPPLDSAANDSASGIPMTTFIDGSFPGDPVAENTLQQMLKDKAAEQGHLPVVTEGVTTDALKAVITTPAEHAQTHGDDSDPLLDKSVDEITDNEMPREDIAADTDQDTSADAPSEETSEVEETTDVSETPVPDTVPDIKTPAAKADKHHKKGKR